MTEHSPAICLSGRPTGDEVWNADDSSVSLSERGSLSSESSTTCTTCGTTRKRQSLEGSSTFTSRMEKLVASELMLFANYTYSDLETRKKTREQAWKVDGWAETVYNTGECWTLAMYRLLKTMKKSLGPSSNLKRPPYLLFNLYSPTYREHGSQHFVANGLFIPEIKPLSRSCFLSRLLYKCLSRRVLSLFC